MKESSEKTIARPLLERTTSRIREVIELANHPPTRSHGGIAANVGWFSEKYPDADVERMASLVVSEIQRYADALVRDAKVRAAVLGRDELLKRWPLETGFWWRADDPHGSALNDLGQHLRVCGHIQAWPPTISFAEAAATIERVPDPAAKTVATLLREGRYSIHTFGVSFQVREVDPAIFGLDWGDIKNARVTIQNGFGGEPQESTSLELKHEMLCVAAWQELDSKWSAAAIACIAHVEKMVRADAARATIPISARNESRQVLSMLHSSDTMNSAAWYRWDSKSERVGISKARDSLVLVWEGRRREPLQLSFNALENEVFEAAVVSSLLKELSADGVRDWLTLHAMAAEQGQTGAFRWSWREHRELGGYSRRGRHHSDEELARAVMSRMRRLKSAEIHAERRIGDKFAWTRIGDHGLIDIVAGIDELTPEGRLTTVAKMQINKALYGGASIHAKRKFYTLIDKRALALPTDELHLYTQLSFCLTSAKGAPVRWRASTLWEYAGVREGKRTKRRHWPDARRVSENRLEKIGKVTGDLSWTVEGDADSPEGIYIFDPHPWMVDRMVHKVTPELGPSTAGLPRTGIELKAWRQARKLSQRALAEAIQVPQQTLSWHEAKGEATLPEAWIGKLAEASRKP